MRAPGTDLYADLYALLGVERAATGAEIRRAYRKLALRTTPIGRGRPAGRPSRGSPRRTGCCRIRPRGRPTTRTCSSASARSAPGAAQSDGGAWSVQSVGWSASFKRAIPNLVPRLSGSLERLIAAGHARLDADGVLELQLTAAEAVRGGTALVEMSLPILCPTCGGVASPRGVWCRRCEHAGRVTETVAVEVRFPPPARDGLVVTATLRQAAVVSQRARLRVSPSVYMRMRVLLLTAPMVQLNTPYPATAYLAGFLRLHADELGLEIAQADPALELFLRLYSRDGLGRVRSALAAGGAPPVASFAAHADRYLETVDAVVAFLQGRDPKLAARIVRRRFLPEGPRFAPLARALGAADAGEAPLAAAYRELSPADRAKHLASLYVDDVADAIREGIDPRFELSRYAEKLAESAASFDPLAAALAGPPTLVDEITDAIGAELCARHRPDVVGISAPFPGNVYGAFRLARAIRRARPATRSSSAVAT